MNLLEFCEEFSISMVKARKMEKRGVLRIDSTIAPEILEIRDSLKRGQILTVAQLVYLADNRAKLGDLGKYQDTAETALATLGDLTDIAPTVITAYIGQAACNDTASVQMLVDWIKLVIPAGRDVSHAYVGARLLLGVNPSIRQFEKKRISRAMFNCRKHPDFAGWWHVVERGSRSITFYRRPEQIMLDL